MYTDNNFYANHLARERTAIGDLVYRSKYLDDPSARNQTAIVGRHIARQIANADFKPHRRFGETDLGDVQGVVAVPFLQGKRSLAESVPHVMAAAIAAELKIPDLSSIVRKTKETTAMKHSATTVNIAESDWFDCSTRLTGKRLLVVDDVFRTGSTLRALGDCLYEHGARSLVGLCLAKATAGMRF